jgi:ATPase subunit of ABC transporter with duplicated ATPase domains
MNQLKADINNDKQMEARKKQSQEIKEALDNPSNSSAKIYKDIIGKKIDGTGEWLKLDPLYASWVVTQQSSTQILYLSGEKGSGKSFLMSTIIEDLKRRYKQRSGDIANSWQGTTIHRYCIEIFSVSNHRLRCSIPERAPRILQITRGATEDERLVGETVCQFLQGRCDFLFAAR